MSVEAIVLQAFCTAAGQSFSPGVRIDARAEDVAAWAQAGYVQVLTPAVAADPEPAPVASPPVATAPRRSRSSKG